jgi:hypothetical protein
MRVRNSVGLSTDVVTEDRDETAVVGDDDRRISGRANAAMRVS